jgi:selenocysteine lyase/cysteine desulfurase
MEATAFSTQKIQHLRAETKGTSSKIHFNNAGSSLPPDVVVDTLVNYLREEAILGGYECEYKYRQQLESVYVSVAKLINAEPDEIALVESASVGWGIAFNGMSFKAGDEIITCEMEYVTNVIGFIHAQKTLGVKIIVIPNDAEGNFDLNGLKAAITPKTKLIAITHIGSSTGGVMPVEEIGLIAHENNILYLVDACQSVGQLPADVKAINCDMLSVTGRKYLRAPRGTGFLFVKKSVQEWLTPFFVDGFGTTSITLDDYKFRDDARRFELYERNRALTLGFGKAVDYALDLGMDNIWLRIQHLAKCLRQQLAQIEGVTLHDNGTQQCGIVTFTVKGMESALIKEKLAERNINTSVGLAKSTLYYMTRHQLTSVVRASLHYYNTEDELKSLCDALRTLAL